MPNYIRHFQTITAHEAKIRQSPNTISCLVNVLKYIKEVLDDDATQTLFEMISHHLNTKDDTAHHLNLELLTDQLFEALQCAFVSIGLYNNDRVMTNQLVDFFEDIYDGSGHYVGSKVVQIGTIYDTDEYVPSNYTNFAKWLLSNPNIYTGEIPDDYDAFKLGLTLLLAKEWFKVNHDTIVDAHANSISLRLSKLIAKSSVSPSYWFSFVSFSDSIYKLIGSDTYEKLMILVRQRLVEMGSPLTVNFDAYEDTEELSLVYGYNESTLLVDSFFQNMFELDGTGVKIIQLDRSSMITLMQSGADVFIGYDTLMDDLGEIDRHILDKKQMNYYSEHLSFVTTVDMTPEYRDELIALRSQVNSNYMKAYHVHTILNKNDFGINISAGIGHLTPTRTIDLINLIGLSKSIVAVSLIPYTDNLNVLHNKLVVSFDNYNPAFTTTLIDDIKEGDFKNITIVLSASAEQLSVTYSLNNNFTAVHFPNTNRMFDADPYFLFVGPKLLEPIKGSTRLSDLKLYGKSLSAEDAEAIIFGFRPYYY